MTDGKAIRLCIVRHGETEENIAHIFQGHLPGTLTANGRRQAEALRDDIDMSAFDVVVSSDLRRVTDTVKILLNGKCTTNWVTSELFREKDWGSITGQTIDKANLKNLPDDVETREMLYDRAGKAICFLKERYAGKTVLLVSHGLFLQSFMAKAAGMTLEHVYSMRRLNNCESEWIDI